MLLSRTGIFVVAILGMLHIAASPAAADYTVTDLGTLPGDRFYGTEAYGINASGQVAGRTFSTPRDTFRAIIWQNGIMSDLGTGPLTTAFGINAAGQVVGGGGGYGFLWQNGRITDLGPVPFAINDSSQIVGASNGRAVVWQNGTMTDLGSGGATAINASGQIVGGSNSHAALWQNGTMTDLGTLGGNFSFATGINPSGAVVGMSRLPGQISFDAFLWQNGIMTDLGPGIANAINDHREVVGETGDVVLHHGQATLWQNGTMTDLNSLIPPDSGWTLWDATALNDAGQIVGNGYHNGHPRGFLLTPNQAPVPEPSTLLLLGIGMFGIIGVLGPR